MIKNCLRASLLFLVLTVFCCAFYPFVVTVWAQSLFPAQANGSLIKDKNGQVVGSNLLGQTFSGETYFHSRPSATSEPYNAAASSGSNLAASNEAFKKAVDERVAALDAANGSKEKIPQDLVTASGSGLDPDITPEAASYQTARIAKLRHREKEAIDALVRNATEGRTFGVFGEPRVNVLKLNMALDNL